MRVILRGGIEPKPSHTQYIVSVPGIMTYFDTEAEAVEHYIDLREQQGYSLREIGVSIQLTYPMMAWEL